MPLTKEDVLVLTKPFTFEEHEFLSTYAYIREDAITARIEQVDPSWSFMVADDVSIEDAAVVRGILTICGVSRTSNGGGTVQREKWIKDKNAFEAMRQDAIAENVANAHKGALTDALKRCARLFGIGRYLLNAPKLKADWNGNLDRTSEEAFRKFLTSLATEPQRPTPAALPMTVVQGGKAAPSSTPSTPTASTPPPAKNASDDFADDLDRHFGKQDTTVDLVGDWHNVTSLTVQKANGVGNFSYVMHTDGGLHIPVFSGDVFRAAGMNPDDWKTPKHEELFSPPLEVFAHNDGKRWTVKQITAGVSA